MSKDKLRILIKILAESHMTFDLGDKIDIRCTDRPALFKGGNGVGLVCLSVHRMWMLSIKSKANMTFEFFVNFSVPYFFES